MLNAIGDLGKIGATASQQGAGVAQAIQQASAKTGVDFNYLLNKASQESGLNPNAKASSSSATGLFQFVEQTWLHVVKTYGPKYGMEAAASRISIDANGIAKVSDPQSKQAILALRKDPTVSANMAAELTNENKSALQSDVGGKIGPTELYLAHFLGAGGASDFLNAMRANPDASAASVLPEAASANPAVFYDKSGAPRSLGQIYQHFARKFDAAPNQSGAVTSVANAAPHSASSLSLAAANLLSALPSPTTTLSSEGDSCADSITSPHGSHSAKANSDAATSSPFAAMMLAQTDMLALSPTATAAAAAHDDERKKKSV